MTPFYEKNLPVFFTDLKKWHFLKSAKKQTSGAVLAHNVILSIFN